MQILISNDDGVHARGIDVLAKKISQTFGIVVIAPDRDCSAASHSLTLDNPIRLTELNNGYISVKGTPTDCVHMAITGYLKTKPDMVVAGINNGANLGDDVLYSGTVAAAIEGRALGFPAIAISLVSQKGEFVHYETAAEIGYQIILRIQKAPLPTDTILNINVPDLPLSEIKGIEVTRLGCRHSSENMVKLKDPRGQEIYWVGEPTPEQDAGPGTDFYAIKKQFISITPLKIDLTDYSALDNLSQWVKNGNLVSH